MTSSSNVIKLHNLRSKTVLIGPGASSCRSRLGLLGAASGAGSGLPGRGQDGVAEIMDGSLAVDWVTELEERLHSARTEAEAVLDQANQEVDEIRRKAYEEGYADGMATAKAETEQGIGRIVELSRNACLDMAKLRQATEDELITLSLAIAEKIVHKRLSEDRSLIASMVDGVFEYVDVVEVIRIRVNPEDLEVLKSCWQETQIGSSGRNIELAADPHVEIGGCIIDTTTSAVDAQIETKLAEIEQAFRADLNSGER